MKTWNIALTFGFAVLFLFVLVLGARVADIQPEKTFADGDMERQEVYRLYIGLNDVDNQDEVMAINEARAIINEICFKHGCGFTSFSAYGGWIDSDKREISERTLEYMISFATEEQITAILDDVMDVLGQTAILVERQLSMQRFYYKKQQVTYPNSEK
ncbi:MAG: hypothetical protein IJP62_01830 [Treponema sp.]|nr:hypothetical protein [Treponema sp.]